MSRGKTNPLANASSRTAAARLPTKPVQLTQEMVNDPHVIKEQMLLGADSWNKWKQNIPFSGKTFYWRFILDGELIDLNELPNTLSDYDLTSCEMKGFELSDIEFPKDLTRFRLENCELTNISFKDTEMIGAALNTSVFKNCTFDNVSFDNSYFYTNQMYDTKFLNCQAGKVHIKRNKFFDCEFENSGGSDWEFQIVSFNNSRMNNCSFPSSLWEKSEIIKSAFNNCNFNQSEWEENLWEECEVNTSSFRGSKASGDKWHSVKFKQLTDVRMWRWFRLDSIKYCSFDLASKTHDWSQIDYQPSQNASHSNKFSQASSKPIPKPLKNI